jgi:hypothetical protein
MYEGIWKKREEKSLLTASHRLGSYRMQLLINKHPTCYRWLNWLCPSTSVLHLIFVVSKEL